MKRTVSLAALTGIALCVLFLVSLAWGQKQSANLGPKYDLTTEQKLKGTIEEVQVDPRPGEGTHLLVKNGTDTTLVHVAPELFLKELEIQFKPGEEVQVVGSKIKNEQTGGPEILMKEITRNNNTFTLRDNKGAPVWAGWQPPKKAD